MTLVTDLRRSLTDSTPVYAVMGVTDIAVQTVRAARVELDPKQLSARAQRVPATAVTLTLEAAGRAEEAYDDLAVRGKKLVDRIRRQRPTQDLLAQGRVTLSRGRAAVTTVRRGGTDTRTAARATVTTAKREGADVAADTRTSVRRRTTGTTSAAKRTATTATTRATRTKSAAKSATTSARKTAAAATRATGAAAAKVGT